MQWLLETGRLADGRKSAVAGHHKAVPRAHDAQYALGLGKTANARKLLQLRRAFVHQRMLGKLWCLGPARIHGKLAWRAALPAVLLLTSLGLKSPGLGHGQLAILISVCGGKAFQPVSQLFLSRLLCLERPCDKQAQQKEVNRFHILSDLFSSKFRMSHDCVDSGAKRAILFGGRFENRINVRAVSPSNFSTMGIADEFADDALKDAFLVSHQCSLERW